LQHLVTPTTKWLTNEKRETNKQTNKQPNKQTNRQTDGQKEIRECNRFIRAVSGFYHLFIKLFPGLSFTIKTLNITKKKFKGGRGKKYCIFMKVATGLLPLDSEYY